MPGCHHPHSSNACGKPGKTAEMVLVQEIIAFWISVYRIRIGFSFFEAHSSLRWIPERNCDVAYKIFLLPHYWLGVWKVLFTIGIFNASFGYISWHLQTFDQLNMPLFFTWIASYSWDHLSVYALYVFVKMHLQMCCGLVEGGLPYFDLIVIPFIVSFYSIKTKLVCGH